MKKIIAVAVALSLALLFVSCAPVPSQSELHKDLSDRSLYIIQYYEKNKEKITQDTVYHDSHFQPITSKEEGVHSNYLSWKVSEQLGKDATIEEMNDYVQDKVKNANAELSSCVDSFEKHVLLFTEGYQNKTPLTPDNTPALLGFYLEMQSWEEELSETREHIESFFFTYGDAFSNEWEDDVIQALDKMIYIQKEMMDISKEAYERSTK